MRAMFTVNYWHQGEGNSCFQQTVPLADALRADGHDIRYCMAGPALNEPEDAGFRTFRAGVETEFVELQRQLGVSHLPADERSLRYSRDLLAGTCADTMATDVLRHARDWRPDIILHEDTEYGGYLAAETLGVPHVQVKVTGMRPLSNAVVLPALNERRAKLGLPEDPDGSSLYRHLMVLPMPPSLYGSDLPPTAYPIRPLQFSDKSGPEHSLELAADRPTVYVTSGNTFLRNPDVLRYMVEAMRDEPVNVVVTTGRSADPGVLGPQPENVTVRSWIPNGQIFRRSDLVVCHGGPATVLGALQHGLPLVVVPFAFDHPWNAERCAAAGVAVVVPEERRRPSTIREAARQALSDPSFRSNAHRIRDEIARLPTVQDAARTIASIAAGSDSPAQERKVSR